MIGAIAGDMIGSIYEARNIRTTEFPLFRKYNHFTDDTVLTVALAENLLTGEDYVDLLKTYFWRYPRAGYGGSFIQWAQSDSREPYGSWGNGSAMRVSPVAYAFDTLETALEAAERSAVVTHDHPEGIKGAQAIAVAVFLARTGSGKAEIQATIEERFGYDLSESLESVWQRSVFDVSCQGSVPPALIAFLNSDDFEDAVRKAISLGGDSDTIACMAGAVAEPYYGGVPAPIKSQVFTLLDDSLLRVVREFTTRFPCR